MTEKECEACEKNRKGVYATPFGADHHHARITELERGRDSMEVSRDLAEAEELKTRKERDSALERVKVLEREVAKTFTAAKELRNMAVANGQERDSARAVIRSFIADFEINGSLPNYALNRLRRVLDSSESPPRAKAVMSRHDVKPGVTGSGAAAKRGGPKLDSKSAREQAEKRRDAEGPPRTQTPNSASNRADKPSSESPPRADMGGDSSRLGESPTDGRATLGQVARGADAAPTKPNAKRGGPKR